MTTSISPDRQRVLQQLEQFRQELLDFSRRNPLLNLKPQRGRLFLDEPGATPILERLQESRRSSWQIFIPAEPDVEGATPPPRALRAGEVRGDKPTRKEALSACAGLHRKAEQEFLDRGTWGLFLALGTLEWRDPADGAKAQPWRSPLVLVPVSLEHRDDRTAWFFRRTEDEVELNSTLSARLELGFDIALPSLDTDDEFSIDAYLNEVRTTIAGRDGWAVESSATLGYFAFHKDAMYADIRDNAEVIADHPIIRAISGAPDEALLEQLVFDKTPESQIDEVHPPETFHSVLDADSTQRQCIIAARDGHSFVMDGPPGSGKSQTITNIIAELMAAGKTVLFVSEKAAALDVVHNRLAERKLDQFVLPLHDHKATRRQVADAFGRALGTRPTVSVRGRIAPAHESRVRREALSSYAVALNRQLPQFNGRTLQQLIGEVALRQRLPHAPVPDRVDQDGDTWSRCQETAASLASTWDLVLGDGSPWAGVSVDAWSPQVQQRTERALLEARRTTETVSELAIQTSRNLRLPVPFAVGDVERLHSVVDALASRPDEVPVEWLTSVEFDDLLRAEVLHAELSSRRVDALERKAAVLGDAASQSSVVIDRSEHDACLADLELLSGAVQHPLTTESLATLSAAASGVEMAADDLNREVAQVAAILGMELAGPSLDVVEWLDRFAGGVVNGQAPPAAWLRAPGAIDGAKADWAALRSQLEYERACRAEAPVFREEALEHDLIGLSARFSSVHRGLKKLGGAYRADKRLLQSIVTAPWKEGVEQLPKAVAWQEARRRLDEAVDRHAARLEATWHGLETDVTQVDAVLASATAFRDDCRLHLRDWPALASAVARVADGDGELHNAHRELQKAIAGLMAASNEAPWRVSRDEGPDALLARARCIRAAADRGKKVVAQLEEPLDPAARGLTVEQALDLGSANATLIEIASAAANEPLLRLLGVWESLERAPRQIRERLAWVEGLRTALGGAVSTEAAPRLLEAVLDSRPLRSAVDEMQSCQEGLIALFEAAEHANLRGQLTASLDEALRLIDLLLSTTSDIPRLQTLAASHASIEALGLSQALEFCQSEGVPIEHVAGVLERSFLEAAVQQIQEEQRAEIGETSGVARDELARRHRRDDLDSIDAAVPRVVEALNSRRPGTMIGPVRVLQVEAEKKRKHRPIRDLLRDGREAALRLKPCFMMSPLSVSRFLPSDFTFDCVIFDEASQVRPSEAIVALYRGKEAIVAGDQKQMPPTSFFSTASSDDDYSEEELDEFDSLLDAAKASAVPSLPLGWHYRSKHESLIAFSNRHYYDSSLLTFPSPVDKSDDLGVVGYRVDGVYTRGKDKTNEKEAQFVVDRVFAHAERGTTSIGVVAFSEPQARLIEETLHADERWSQYPELESEDRLEGVFVKNLENVQGDERDVIIFSVGYGPDPDGKFSLNFGPVNGANGPRRLNVAITRARRRSEIVSSFEPSRLAGSNADGIQQLREYLEYAHRGSLPPRVDDQRTIDTFDSPFEEEVARVLRSHGYEVTSQVGVAGYRIDLGVRDRDRPGRFAIGIECDGATYHSSRTARDRDRLRQQLLEGLGWRIHRVWSTSWFLTRGAAEHALLEAVRAAIAGEGSEPELGTLRDRVVAGLVEVDQSEAPTWTTEYRPAKVGFATTRDLTAPAAAFEVRETIRRVVKREGPIVPELLERRVCAHWNASVTAKRCAAIRVVLQELVGEGVVLREQGAIRRHDLPLTVVRVPGEDEHSQRLVQEIPPAELDLAVLKTIEGAGSSNRDELTESVARLFGWSRRGARIVALLDEAIDRSIASGALRVEGELLYPAAQSEDA